MTAIHEIQISLVETGVTLRDPSSLGFSTGHHGTRTTTGRIR